MSFRVLGLDPTPFRNLYGLSDSELMSRGVERVIVDANPGFPDRVEICDGEPGDTMLLLNYTHQPGDTPYKASHAIFVREGAAAAYDKVDEIPAAMLIRPISLRAFDATHRMVDADLVPGSELEGVIKRLLSDAKISYLQAHYAKRGCYAARIERA